MTSPSDRASLALPFRFDGRDFARAMGPDLRRAQARHLLLTEPGEVPWRTEFGAGLGRLRHRRRDAVLVELARIDVRDAFRRWLPAVQISGLEVTSIDDALVLRVPLADAGATTVAEVTA